jgi:hypothetical protein
MDNFYQLILTLFITILSTVPTKIFRTLSWSIHYEGNKKNDSEKQVLPSAKTKFIVLSEDHKYI